MKNQIKKIQDYFKSKMLSQDFEIKEVREHTMKLLIDTEYEFTIWIGNADIPNTRQIHDGTLSFMNIQFTRDESKKLHEILLPAVNKFKKETLLNKKKQELEKLQKEINAMS